MRYGFVFALLFLLPATGMPATYYVPGDFSTIQGAIDGVSNGDTIIVRPGTYTSYFGGFTFRGKAVTLRSEQGPAVTIFDMRQQTTSVVFFKNGEGPGSVLDGFTITNGYDYHGGGILCDSSSPTIMNNIITGNTGYHGGGGIACENYSSPTIKGNIISGNTAAGFTGGGIECSLFSSNPNIVNNTITGNTATTYGGGISCSGSATITNNILTGNTAAVNGGGIYIADSDIIIANNTISGNTASVEGGGIYNQNPFARTIVNNIVWDNSAPVGPEISGYYGITEAIYCDVKGGWPGTGNIDADPLFLDPGDLDFHLLMPSPCRDAGDNSAVLDLYDFEGDVRITDGIADMGADEFHHHLYYSGDLVPGGSGKIIAIAKYPNPCLLALSGLRNPPTPTPYGDLYLTLPLWKQWPFAVTTDGTQVIPVVVPSGASPGDQFYFQALIGPSGLWNSKLTNLMTLTVE